MTIGILGASGIGLLALQLAIQKSGHDVVVICEDDVIDSNDIVLRCGGSLPDIGDHLLDIKDMQTNDNSFRGGSRGKSGKIKYQRG